MKINCSQNINYKGRCSQIRDAQWVSHCVNTEFPHFSPSRVKPIFERFIVESFPEKNIEKLSLISDVAIMVNRIKNEKFGIYQKFSSCSYIDRRQAMTPRDRIISFMDNVFTCFGEIRTQYQKEERGSIYQHLRMLKEERQGNCQELSAVAELVMSLNNVNAKNAYLYDVKNEQQIDHAVCVFNRDGSDFTGKVNNKTIIIDPLLNKVDFAKNMFSYYKNCQQDNMGISSNSKFKLVPYRIVSLSDDAKRVLQKKYPNLIFNSKTHSFMKEM